MRVLAFDPGKQTGVVEAWVHDGIVTVTGFWELVFTEALAKANEFCRNGGDVVVCERFGFRPGRVRTAEYEHLEIIGALRWLTWCNHLEFVLQNVSDAKKIRSVRHLGVIGGDGHARDAARHLILYCQSMGMIG